MSVGNLGGLYQPLGDRNALRGRNETIKQANYELKGGRFVDLTPSTPMAVRKMITAQCNDYADNGENVRSRTLFHDTPIGIGWGLTLAARLLRVVVRTLGVVVSVPVAAFQQSRYGRATDGSGNIILRYNLVAQDFRSIGHEWQDLFITAFAVPVIGTINTFAPQAISTRGLAEMYLQRSQDYQEKNANFAEARARYVADQDVQQRAWREARDPV